MELPKESWEFITNIDDPDFVVKFENLIQAYIQNAYDNLERFSRSDVLYFREATRPKNWLMKFQLPYWEVLKEGQEKIRLKGFWHYAEALHLTDDYFCLYGEDDSSYKMLFIAYARLLKAHKLGFEEEKRSIKEKIKNPLGTLRSFFSTRTKND